MIFFSFFFLKKCIYIFFAMEVSDSSGTILCGNGHFVDISRLDVAEWKDDHFSGVSKGYQQLIYLDPLKHSRQFPLRDTGTASHDICDRFLSLSLYSLSRSAFLVAKKNIQNIIESSLTCQNPLIVFQKKKIKLFGEKEKVARELSWASVIHF